MSISMCRETQINHAIAEKEPGPLIFTKTIERHATPGRAVASPWNARLNYDWAAKLLRACGDIECMQSLHVVGRAARNFFRRGDDVECTARLIDDGSARN